jgi:hypothetical protein
VRDARSALRANQGEKQIHGAEEDSMEILSLAALFAMAF